MKKEDLLSLVAYFLMIAIALIVGLVILRPLFAEMTLPLNPYLFVILAIVIGLFVNVLFLEIGHVLGALIGKYKITSFNVLWMCIYKDKGKWHFGFKNFDGLVGETRVAPKSDKANPKPYVLFPILFFVIELALTTTFYVLAQQNIASEALVILGLGGVIFLALGAMIAVYNLFPARLDSMNDGYRLVLFSKPINIKAFNELMRVEEMQLEGKEIQSIPFFEEITDFTASLNLSYVYECLSKKEYQEAEEKIDLIIINPKAISTSTYNRLVAQKLYIQLMTKPIEEAKKYYETLSDSLKRFISNDVSMESVRAYVLIAGLIEESKGEVQYVNSRKQKALKRAISSRAEAEKQLYKEALNKVLEAHPDWDLSHD